MLTEHHCYPEIYMLLTIHQIILYTGIPDIEPMSLGGPLEKKPSTKNKTLLWTADRPTKPKYEEVKMEKKGVPVHYKDKNKRRLERVQKEKNRKEHEIEMKAERKMERAEVRNAKKERLEEKRERKAERDRKRAKRERKRLLEVKVQVKGKKNEKISIKGKGAANVKQGKKATLSSHKGSKK